MPPRPARRPPPLVDEDPRSPEEILAELERLNAEIAQSFAGLRQMLSESFEPREEARAEEGPSSPSPPASGPPPQAPPRGQTAFAFDAAPIPSIPRAERRAPNKESEMPVPATGRAKRLSPEALLVLDACTVEGHIVRIPPASSVPGLASTWHAPQDRLARKLYEEVNAALGAIGGTWTGRKVQGHVFADDPKQALEAVVVTGAFTNPRDVFAFFETPAELARRVVESANIQPGMRVLEPSAGRGAIVRALWERFKRADGNEPYWLDLDLEMVEVDPAKEAALEKVSGGRWHIRDFLSTTAGDIGGPVDRVVANPPFSVPGLAHADIAHVTHAYELLKPGGRLVAIMGAGVTFRTTAPYREFRAWTGMGEGVIEALKARPDEAFVWGGPGGIRGEIEQLPAGTFKSSGTGVATVMIILDKPA